MKLHDDFRWNTYHSIWREQYEGMTKDDYKWIVEDFSEEDGELIINDNIHPNAKEIYCDVFRLKPDSVFEAGCGAGYHLINIKKTSPWVEVSGCDRNEEMLAMGETLFNTPSELSSKIAVHNLILSPFSGEYDFIFTNAVTMHLPWDHAKKVLKNIADMSKRYVLLIENYSSHNYEKLIEECFPDFESGLLYEQRTVDTTDGQKKILPHMLRPDSSALVEYKIGKYCGKYNSIWFLERT